MPIGIFTGFCSDFTFSRSISFPADFSLRAGRAQFHPCRSMLCYSSFSSGFLGGCSPFCRISVLKHLMYEAPGSEHIFYKTLASVFLMKRLCSSREAGQQGVGRYTTKIQEGLKCDHSLLPRRHIKKMLTHSEQLL